MTRSPDISAAKLIFVAGFAALILSEYKLLIPPFPYFSTPLYSTPMSNDRCEREKQVIPLDCTNCRWDYSPNHNAPPPGLVLLYWSESLDYFESWHRPRKNGDRFLRGQTLLVHHHLPPSVLPLHN